MSLEARGILFVSPGMEVTTTILHFVENLPSRFKRFTDPSFFLLFERHMKA